MLPRINIPWYRVAIRESKFEDTSQVRPFKFDMDKPKTSAIIPTKAFEPVLAPVLAPVIVPLLASVPSLVPKFATNPALNPVPSTVPNPALNPVPSTVPNPALNPVPSTVPKEFTEPVSNPLPKTWDIPLPSPSDIPRTNPKREKETQEKPVNNPPLKPAPTFAQMREQQKESQRQIINEKAYRELVQYDMLMERNLAQRRIIEKNSKLSANNLTQYQKFIQGQNVTNYNRLPMSKEVMERQTKAFNQAIEKLEVKLGESKDIILDYIQNNEISIGTLPYHYKEINKKIAEGGLTGIAVGAIAYIIYQIAKVGLMAYGGAF